MNPAELANYANLLGGTSTVRTFDAGQSIFIRVGVETFSGSWVDRAEYNEVMKRAARWLNNQPWPTENDPRVEGEY